MPNCAATGELQWSWRESNPRLTNFQININERCFVAGASITLLLLLSLNICGYISVTGNTNKEVVQQFGHVAQ